MSGPAEGRRSRAPMLRALLPCLALVVWDTTRAGAQTAPPPDLFRPAPDGSALGQDLPLRKTIAANSDDSGDPSGNGKRNTPAPSRIGQLPTYGVAAANGASDTGFDSLNRPRSTPTPHPGEARPKPPPGPGSAAPAPPPVDAAGSLRLSIPPSELANKTPLPPAMAGTVEGQPPRERLKVDDDPFGAVGDYAGSFLIKSAVELSGGYDTNPGRLNAPKGMPFWVVAPEFLAVSDWDRHALVADLRGSFTGYGNSLAPTIAGAASPAPTNIDRPDFTGHIDGRLDVSQDTHITSELRLRVSTDNPGSPNIQAGLASYPIYTTLGGSLGIDQSFNRLDVAVGGTVDRTVYQDSTLTDGTTASNDDRNFNQYGGVGRVSYELTPGMKPFIEVEGDSRVHDLQLDRNGFARDSDGGYAKAGTSGVLTHLYTVEVDHDFRRWLTAIGKFTYGTLDYQGDGRSDTTYSIEGDVIYKLTRNLWIKGTLRRDILNSNIAGASSASTVVMAGVRVQN
jgi:hypothetical protein